MNFLEEAKEKWDYFLRNKITEYEKFRNYDYGPSNENAVSILSPFISHRILLEYELIKNIQTKNQGYNLKKFVEEIYWRIYWKGWLENKPDVWEGFLISSRNNDFDKSLYEKAVRGETELFFFNSWLEELKTHNYLHNHTRMWFASTWIFSLGLPWELGAKLFFKYLYDGDAASNLLSWRWVAGLHSNGKRYLYSPENLRKFSNKRFNVENIKFKDIVIEDQYKFIYKDDIYKQTNKKQSDYLILFENDLHESSLRETIESYKKAYLVILNNEDRKIKISSEVINFKKKLCLEFASKFTNLELICSKQLLGKLNNVNQLDLIYPSIGENYDFIKRFKLIYEKTIIPIVREEDLFSWKFAKRGFFKFKENIPKINKFIKIK